MIPGSLLRLGSAVKGLRFFEKLGLQAVKKGLLGGGFYGLGLLTGELTQGPLVLHCSIYNPFNTSLPTFFTSWLSTAALHPKPYTPQLPQPTPT